MPGRAGLNGEHSPLDAVALGIVVDWSLEYIYRNREQSINEDIIEPLTEIPTFVELKNHGQDPLIESISVEYQHYFTNLDFAVLNFTEYGSSWIKQQKFSPDSFFQMIIQYAYYKLNKKPCATYETATTRQFFHGILIFYISTFISSLVPHKLF